jgi:hypothetical protein
LWLIAAIGVGATHAAAPSSAESSVFPFVKGTSWTYAATVRWTVPDSSPTVVRRTRMPWSSTVIDAFDHGDVAGALVRGPVWELAWWDPSRVPDEALILRLDHRYYIFSRGARRLFAAVNASGPKALPSDRYEYAWFDAPLRQGVLLRPDDIDRKGSNYGWLVELSGPMARETTRAIGGSRRSYRLTFETLASDEHVTIVPGIGPTAFAYRHHGTVAEAQADLIAFHRGDAK